MIKGGSHLEGEVSVAGAKNACLPIFAATLLTDQKCVLKNVPDLSDVRFMTKTGFSRTMPRVRLERLLFFMTGCSRIKFLVC